MLKDQHHFYLLDFENVGGLVMPILIDIVYDDGSKDHVRIPAEIWRQNNRSVTKLWITDKVIESVTLDPNLETADTDLSNNVFPQKIAKSRFEVVKPEKEKNAMQKAVEGKKEAEDEDKKDKDVADEDE